MTELKPCPFCGKAPKATKQIQGYGPRVSCQNYWDCRMSALDSMDIKAWNRRAPINKDQAIKDSLEQRNDKLRSDDA